MKKSLSINYQKLFLELVVVFLGVTAGFILNNLRDEKQNIKIEEKYIQSFLQNIDSNIVELKSSIADDSIRLKNLEKINTLVLNKIPKDSLAYVINTIVFTSKTIIATSAFDDIKYSGNLNIIRDFNLKENIVSYPNTIEGVKYIEAYYNSFFSDFILPFVINEVNPIEGKFFNNNDQVRLRLLNISVVYYSLLKQRMDVINNLLDESYLLKDKLTTYLIEEF